MNIITTNKVNCKDCYKCVRHCPVNAIQISDGHAQVVASRCILCGTCYKICPQQAKNIRNDVALAENIILNNNNIIASIAPAFFAYYDEKKRDKLITAMYKLGFGRVECTSRGVKSVALEHLKLYENGQKLIISSSCPTIANLIEKYYPDLIQYLAPVKSPVVVHAEMLNKEYPNGVKVIFISPCIAKKEEIQGTNIIANITFRELEDWIEREKIYLDSLPAIKDKKIFYTYSRNSSLFPLIGGLVKKAGLPGDAIAKEIISVSGVENTMNLFELIQQGKLTTGFIEVLGCEGGCVSGPARPKCEQEKSYFELKNNLIKCVETAAEEENEEKINLNSDELTKTFKARTFEYIKPTEEQILDILKQTGKTRMEEEHNCGACGYNSCREKAVAVINGMAEAEMCIPYMRSKAERMASTVIRNTPNGIIFLDKDYNVLDVNPAFKRMFGEDTGVIDKDSPAKSLITYNDRKYNRLKFSVPDKNLIIAIFVDITDAEAHRHELNKTKKETLDRAQKVINKQMRVAQEIASLLGESTAETKVLLGQLMKTMREE